QPSRIFRRPKERKTRLQLCNRALERSPALVLLRIETESGCSRWSPPILFPCHHQHQVVSEVALLLLPGVDPRFWQYFAHPCRESLGGKHELGETTRCDNGVRPLTSLLSSTRTHHASSS
ncbi:unnamed protein product, partial [Ectocarpus sp. 13 AM-2016]